MRPHSTAWHKYQNSAREFEAVLEHAKAVSNALVGLSTRSSNETYGEQIFVTLLAQCMTLRRIAPNPLRATADEFWDLPSLCAIARCAIEAHDSFMYISAATVPENERDFRVHLWELHDKTRRLKMLSAIGSQNPEVESIRSDVIELEGKVLGHSMSSTLNQDTLRKIRRGDPPAFHTSQQQRCNEAGLNYHYHNAVTMQLSQYVHCFPFALHQLFLFRAGTEESLGLMSLPFDFVIAFLGRVTEEMRTLFPSHTPEPPARTARTMAFWAVIYRQGVGAA